MSMRGMAGISVCWVLLAAPVLAQQDASLNLRGAIDFHVHMSPDSVPRAIDADDLARLAKAAGMRGMVMKNHWEPTASMVYLLRKEVPGIELFGGVTQDLAVGGINLEAVKHMAEVKGGYGRVVWLPTFDSENSVRGKGPQVPVAKDGKLLPGVLELLDYIAAHPQLVLETGHVSAEEALLVVREARARGVKHIVVTHAMNEPIGMTIPQMQQAARDGAFIEFVYGVTLPLNSPLTVAKFAEAIRAIGAKSCIIATDLGGRPAKPPNPPRPMPPQGLLDFMRELHRQGISVDDINQMAKANPALALGLDVYCDKRCP
jgi:Family of unknown function (DUF6282)